MSLPEYREETCKRCGICCHAKIRFLGKVFIDMSKPCEYLDKETNLCTVYEKRRQVQPYCQLLHVVLEEELMPGTCAYVKELKQEGQPYKDPIVVSNLD